MRERGREGVCKREREREREREGKREREGEEVVGVHKTFYETVRGT